MVSISINSVRLTFIEKHNKFFNIFSGNLIEGCKSAGPHFNPAGVNHGGPFSAVRHVGDLGNIFA